MGAGGVTQTSFIPIPTQNAGSDCEGISFVSPPAWQPELDGGVASPSEAEPVAPYLLDRDKRGPAIGIAMGLLLSAPLWAIIYLFL